MMVSEILREIAERGLTIAAVGDDLRLQGPRHRIDTALVERIRAAKAELVAHLVSGADGPDRPGGLGSQPEPSTPLTPLQRAYLVGRGDLADMGNVASHVYHEIEGVWDIDRLESALRSVVQRHSLLRTRFTADGGQVALDTVPVHVGRLDLRPLPGAAQAELRSQLRQEWSHRMLPVDRAPLLAADVTILADDRMVLHVSHDGLVIDGISMLLFFHAWWAAYTGTEAGADELRFGDYVAAVEAARTKAPALRSRAHWLDRLDDLPPHPDLPLATTPAAITKPRFTQRLVTLDAAGWSAVKARAARSGVTPTALLLTGYAQTLACWGAGSRFTLNTTFAHRPPVHPRIFDAIGQFSDTMLVEVVLDQQATFDERARAVQARLRADLDNRHFSGIEVLRELGRRGEPARAPYTFNSTIGYVRGDVDGCALELFGPEVFSVSQTPQVWLNAFVMERRGGLVVQLDSVDELFPPGLPDALAEGYQTLLRELVGEPAWSARTFDLRPAVQRRRRAAANDTAAPQGDELLGEAFVRAAVRAPGAPAVVTSRSVLSYGELHRRASAAAAWLRERGTGRDELVALVMTRGPEQVVGILATVLAGGAYLPIDAGLPAQRRAYMLRDGRVRCVLTNAPAHCTDLPDGLQVLVVDASRPADAGRPVALPPLPGAGLDDLAYVLYTSGTTGQPKGVMVSHRSVANVVADCNARFRIGPADRFFGINAFTFDLSVWDVFGALSAGAAIVLPDHDRAADPAHWVDLCAGAGVTVWSSVPAIVGLLHDHAAAAGEAARLATLRLVMMSGDRIPPALPAKLRSLLPQARLVSLGGPTETTIWNILHPIRAGDDGSGSIPYGRPNANNRAYILDAAGQDTPDWVTGEICAAGVGLARGYWGDEARTADRFYLDPARGERLYRTGDLGRYLPDGDIEILGRKDFQIKVNGYRIEAGEVETRLAALEAVKQTVVVRQEGSRGDRLVAHVAAAGNERPTMDAIREQLRVHLPEYMIPSAVVWHEALPLTRNGKVDRAALAAAPAEVPSTSDTSAAVGAGGPGTETTRPLAAIWAGVLRRPAVDLDADFYELGGDSLAAARILTQVRKDFGVTIPLDQFYRVATVRLMAAHLAGHAGEGASR